MILQRSKSAVVMSWPTDLKVKKKQTVKSDGLSVKIECGFLDVARSI